MNSELSLKRTPTALRVSRQVSRVVIRPIGIIFWAVFFCVFSLSGGITMLGVIPYRMGAVSLLVLPLMGIYGVKLDIVIIAYGVLVGAIFLSALYNGSSLFDLLMFLRIVAFSSLIYYLVERFVRPGNVTTVLRTCVWVALIQLPIVLAQKATYNLLPAALRDQIHATDYCFGTFNFKGDAAMSFFLLLLIAFLLFEHRRNYIVKHRLLIVLWLSVTVLVANSEITHLLLAAVWAAYFLARLNRRTTIALFVAAVLTLGAIAASGYLAKVTQELDKTLDRVVVGLKGDPKTVERYLQGGYSRGGAIYYYLNSDPLWLGDGPNRYSDPIQRQRLRGNVGHAFTFYSEVGIVGWLASVVITLLITFRRENRHLRITPFGLTSFACIMLLSFTSQVMNDISIMLAYCIMSKTYLVPPQAPAPGTQLEPRDSGSFADTWRIHGKQRPQAAIQESNGSKALLGGEGRYPIRGCFILADRG